VKFILVVVFKVCSVRIRHVFFFFFDMFTQEEKARRRIRTSGLYFIRRDPNRLNYLLEILGMSFLV
jgi:hypothetical protein